jgi:hypothetical protein
MRSRHKKERGSLKGKYTLRNINRHVFIAGKQKTEEEYKEAWEEK